MKTFTIFALMIFTGCAHNQAREQAALPESKADQARIVEISTQLVEGLSVTRAEYSDLDLLRIPKNLIDLRTVTRRVAELRSGPGIEFNLHDNFLRRGDEVVVVEKSDRWIKVSDSSGKKIGWVHKLALSEERSERVAQNATRAQFASYIFPTVFAASEIQQVYSFPNKENLNLKIPRGASFKMLREERGKKLLWYSQGNIVFWGDSSEFL